MIEEQMSFNVDSIQKYWARQDERLLHIMTAMESAEDWVLDDNKKIKDGLAQLGKKMNANNIDWEWLFSNKENLLFVMAYMRCSSSIYFLHSIESLINGSGLKIVQDSVRIARDHADKNVHSQIHTYALLLLERLGVLKKLNYLGKVFDPSRVSLVLKAIEQIRLVDFSE